MARAREDFLLDPIEQLTKALLANAPGRERDWAERLNQAVDGMQRALLQHNAAAESPDGMFTEVDLTRPTLLRRMNQLRQEHKMLLEQAQAFQGQVQNALQAFQPSADTLPRPAAVCPVPDFGIIRRDGEHLVAVLQRHREEETKLVLESVTTEIGVCD